MSQSTSAQFDRLSEFVAAPDIPDSARDMAAVLLLDTIGVAAGAHDMEPSRIAKDFAFNFMQASDPCHSAPLVLDGRRVSIPGAAFAAATQIDNLDGHDGYNPTKGHIGCAVVPALLAFAANQPDLTSLQALDILAMSYELGARAAIALHQTVDDYHTSGAWNALAVATIGCRLLDADKTQLRTALGIAEYHGPRSQMMREIANPSMLHDGSGMGALAGAMAALLARQGFEASPAVTIEAPEVSPVWSDLGQNWTIEKNYIKPYPICRWAHAALYALSALMRNHKLTKDDIVKAEVRTFAESAALFAGVPTTSSQAQYSLPFAVAAMMHHGEVGPEQVTGKGLEDVNVAALLSRIEVKEDPRFSAQFPARRMASVLLELNDGSVLQSGEVDARGGPEAPLTEQEIEAKFYRFSQRTLGSERCAALWQMRHRMLEPEHRFDELLKLVHANPNTCSDH